MVFKYENWQYQNYLFCALHKYIQYSIIKKIKFWKTKTKLEQIAISLEIVLVFSKNIKTKCNFVLATKFRTEAKPAFWSIDKKLIIYCIIGFVNWKQKVKARIDDNQVIQTQNQNLSPNLRLENLTQP